VRKSQSIKSSNPPLESPSTTANLDVNLRDFKEINTDAVLSFDSGLDIPRPLKMLLVEDNPINMMLLATYMKKKNWDYETAANGLLALQAFQNRPQGFDIIFMDVSMPIMTGYEATLAIRNVETERRLADELQYQLQAPSPTETPTGGSYPFPDPIKTSITSQIIGIDPKTSSTTQRSHPALIIALTGFSSKKDQEMAFEAGVDVFMTKPVRFREVGRILDGWTKNREMELQQVHDAMDLGQKERRELDEEKTGAKRSG